MNRKKIIATVKAQEEEKVPFSLKLPASLKEDIQLLAEHESVSMNSLIVTVLHSFMNDDCGKDLVKMQGYLSNYMSYLENRLDSLNAEPFHDKDDVIHREELEATIKAIYSLLEK
jgi:hypothetical protein